jgi:ABC-type sugar transport system ATPase subunit
VARVSSRRATAIGRNVQDTFTSEVPPLDDNVFEIRNISKHFAGVKALDDVSFEIKRGTCHCLIGENGAGKSTLIKILTGAHQKSSGSVIYNGKDFSPQSTRDAMRAGIGCLFQELNVVEQLRVEENICLGIEETRFGVLKPIRSDSKVFKILNRIDSTIDPKSYIEDLSIAKRQVVEIAKALAMESDVIIMDEPTAALSSEEVRRLFEIICDLKQQGVTVIYISHRLDEIFEIGDYVTVLRDGKMVGTKPRSEIESRKELIKMMIGKFIMEDYVPGNVDRTQVVVEVVGLSNSKLHNVSFSLYKGEILGLYGLIGAGKTEIARALFGADRAEGSVKIHQNQKVISSPGMAISSGLALVPEERRTQGLCTSLPISANVPMMNYRPISARGFVSAARQGALTRGFIKKLSITCLGENQVTAFLSGGNQQKVVLAKCLNSDAGILLLDEPTRGVDVGAKQEIFAIIRQLAQQGNSVIVFSSELPEVLGLCDRIGLLFDGALKAMIENDGNVNTHDVLHIVTGGEIYEHVD